MSAPLSINPGTTANFQVEVEDPSGDAFDLTDFAIYFFVKRSLQDADAAALWQGTLDLGLAITYTLADGIISVTIPKANTALMRMGREYFWYVRLVHSGDDSTFQPNQGMFLATFSDTH